MPKIILSLLVVMTSVQSFANCISLTEAKSVAIKSIDELSKNDPQGDYFLWQDAIESLQEVLVTNGNDYVTEKYTTRFSLSNWEDIEIDISCDGTFSYSAIYTEN